MLMDLNLYKIFSAILRHGSVSRAAQSLGLTQPATSNALTRLRQQLDDPLFIRSKNGMLPTKFAKDMAPEIEQALAALEGVEAGPYDNLIDIGRLRGNFTLVMSDLEEVLFLSKLITGLATAAPAVTIEVRPFRRDNLQDELELEKVDFVIANLRVAMKNVISRPLASQDFVCVSRRNHPAINKADKTIPVDTYLAQNHILVSPDRGGRHGVVDSHLSTLGQRRRVTCAVPHFLSACLLVADSDHIVTLPRLLATRATRYFDLQTFELPFTVESFPIALHWLSTRQRDRDHAAFRNFALTTLV
jgi:DNA-binding transcriptional LysR family regulator